jgi:hypothetical protein
VPHALHMPSHIFTRLGMLECANLQTAQDGPAKAVVDELTGFRQSAGAKLTVAYAVAAIPARFVLERRDWSAAAALSAPETGVPLERFPLAEAMISYPRARRGADREHHGRTGRHRQAAVAQIQTLGGKQYVLGQSGRGRALGGGGCSRPRPRR